MITPISTSKNIYIKNISNKEVPPKKEITNNTENSEKICYYYPLLSFRGEKKKSSYDSLKISIPNLHCVNGRGLRGESLLTKRNICFLPSVKQAGIKSIIDLKTVDYTPKYTEQLEKNSLKYFHFPIDASNIEDREIIDNMSEFFKIINKGDFYIACAQGLHRTDIALALNYIFNKDETNPPVLYGHLEKSNVRCCDIFKRTNSIFKNLTEDDRKKLGLENFDEKQYKLKKKKLIDYNYSLI